MLYMLLMKKMVNIMLFIMYLSTSVLLSWFGQYWALCLSQTLLHWMNLVYHADMTISSTHTCSYALFDLPYRSTYQVQLVGTHTSCAVTCLVVTVLYCKCNIDAFILLLVCH